ncbi:MAG: GNAT family N-acetyltransferase [Acidobacteriota bacterium]
MYAVLNTALKKIWGTIADGSLFSGHPELLPMDLDRDYPEIEPLLIKEEWPFVRGDMEISHAQPKATAFIARKDGKFAGFFTTHNFAEIGYLDMMIIAPAFRRAGIARPLYFHTINELKRQGIRAFVVHTTNDSARIIKLLGFKPCQHFTLLVRDPLIGIADSKVACEIVQLGKTARDELINLDSEIFGMARPEWFDALLAQPEIRFYGLRKAGRLAAALCLRPRRGGALCIDCANAHTFADLTNVVNYLLMRYRHTRIECFARTGSELYRTLGECGFVVPDFFKAIGPLMEWRKGVVGEIGKSPKVQCLSWL